MKLHNFDFSKKIFFHPENIVKYREGKRPFPVTIEIDLTNRCNHRCSFCYNSDFFKRDKSSLDPHVLIERLKEAYELGTKGIGFTGGGEPMMHKDFVEILKKTRQVGFDVGLITNGSLINEKNIDDLIKNLQWIRISMGGGNKNAYMKIQGVDHFERVVFNIKLLSKRKKELNSNLNIGIRILVTPENINSVLNITNIVKDLNINYLQLAPDQFTNDGGKFWNSKNTQEIFEESKKILEEKPVYLLTTAYMWVQNKIDFPSKCYAHFFKIAITAEGYAIFCQNARENRRYYMGNIYKNSLNDIWQSEKLKNLEEKVRPNNCGLFCKHMPLNISIEEILHPDEDMSPNFIG